MVVSKERTNQSVRAISRCRQRPKRAGAVAVRYSIPALRQRTNERTNVPARVGLNVGADAGEEVGVGAKLPNVKAHNTQGSNQSGKSSSSTGSMTKLSPHMLGGSSARNSSNSHRYESWLQEMLSFSSTAQGSWQ
jgi:hypothetical protein